MARQPQATVRQPTPSFQDIMDTPMSDITPPVPIPAGSYIVMVVGHANEDTASTGTKYYVFTLQLQEALEDVDGEALEKSLTGMDGTVKRLQDKTIQSDRYYQTDASLFRLKKFLNDLGIEDTHDDGSPKGAKEALMEVPGRQCMVTVTHRQGNSGGIFANVSSTSPLK